MYTFLIFNIILAKSGGGEARIIKCRHFTCKNLIWSEFKIACLIIVFLCSTMPKSKLIIINNLNENAVKFFSKNERFHN